MAAIGILGGMGPQASAHLLSLLVRAAPMHLTIKLDTDFPEIVLLSIPMPNFVENKDNLNQAKKLLIDRTRLLEQAGCIVGGIACNTAHLMLNDIQSSTSIEFVSIPALAAQRITDARWKRVGLLASPNSLDSRLFDDALPSGVSLIRPPHDVRIIDSLQILCDGLLSRFVTKLRLVEDVQ